MEIIDVKNLPLKDTPHNVEARGIFTSEHIELVHLELEPGQSLLPHITPVDVLFYVLDGKGLLTIGDENEIFKKDQAAFSPKEIKHKWKNIGDEKLQILVLKTPKPTKSTKIL